MNWHDPTAIDLDSFYSRDPYVARIRGWTAHGNIPIDVPFISPIAPNLLQGGVEEGLTLPLDIDFVLSLYRFSYPQNGRSVHLREVKMYDSLDQSLDQVDELATWVNERRQFGKVLVHCQAGLNRSSVVVARALLLNGDVETGQEAIDLIRSQRGPGALSNKAFEDYVRSMQ